MWIDEEKDDRIQQSHRQPCLDAHLRPGFSKWLSIFRKRAAALYLIRNAFDEVDYLLKRRGTELVLTKKLE